jgi:hypothetical protein
VYLSGFILTPEEFAAGAAARPTPAPSRPFLSQRGQVQMSKSPEILAHDRTKNGKAGHVDSKIGERNRR